MIFQILILFIAVSALWYLKYKDDESPLPGTTVFVIFIQSFFTAALSGAAIWIFTGSIPEKYHDFIGGFLAISGMTKTHEYNAFYCAAAVFILIWTLLTKLHRQWESEKRGQDARMVCYYSFIPGIIMAGQALRCREFFFTLLPGCAGVAAGIIVLALFRIFRDSENKNAPLTLLTSIFLFAGSLLGTLITEGFSGIDLSRLMIVIFSAGLFLSIKFDRWKIVLITSQLGIPLCYFHLLPIRMILKNGDIFDPGFNILPNIITGILIFTAYFTLFTACRKKNGKISDHIPTMVIAALISCFCAAAESWPGLIGDDYHEAESALPWYLLWEKGMLPYADYAPSRGLLNYICGFLVHIFRGEHDFSWLAGMLKYADLPLYIAALAMLRKYTGLAAAAAALTAVTGLSPHLGAGVLAGFLVWLFLLDKRFEKHPVEFLVWFTILGIAGTIYSLTDFLPFYIGIFPLALYETMQALKLERKKFLLFAATVLPALTAVMMIAPLRKMIFSMVELLFLQSGSYTAAHCVPHMPALNKEAITPGFLWDAFRYGFIGMGGIFLATMLAMHKEAGIRKFLSLSAPVILCVIMIQRAGGRVDTGNYSRIYLLSSLIWAVFLPVWYKVYLPRKWNLTLLASVIWLTGLGIYGSQMKCFENLTILCAGEINEPENCFAAADAGLPRLGKYPQLKPDHFKHHLEIKKFSDSFLKPGETIWDHALPLAMRYPSYFYAAEPRLAQKLAAEVAENLPVLALIEGRNIEFHEGKLPLRSYPLYRLLMDNYRGFQDVYGKVWMIRKGEESRLAGNPLVKTGSLDNMDILVPAVADKKIDTYPSVWGNSFDSLAGKMEKIADLTPFSRSTTRGVLLPPGNMNGDFLLLHFDRMITSPMLQLNWSDDFHGKGQPFITFAGRNDIFLIPLSTAPNWYLSRKKHNLAIIFAKEEENTPAIIDCSVWRRKN